MSVRRWSLDQLVAAIGAGAVLALFIPTGLYLVLGTFRSSERVLVERGKALAQALAGQVAAPLLVEDALAVRVALERAAADPLVRYVAVEGARGEITAHTLPHPPPAALADLWKASLGGPVRFRSAAEALLDVSAPVVAEGPWRLHVGLSRAGAVAEARGTIWVLGAGLVVAVALVLGGAHLVGVRVSGPLSCLEAAVARFPQSAHPAGHARSGTREVVALAEGFARMARRLEALYEERAATQTRMIQAERLAALGEIAAGLAHEILNPLDGVQECLRFLDRDPHKSERAAKYYPMLASGLERIARTMRDMLMFARVGQEVCLRPHRLTSVLESHHLMVRTHLKDRQVELTWMRPGPWVCVCDQRGLEQAFLNLVLNAAEAAEGSARPQVRIEAGCEGPWVCLAVEDSGPGVSEDLRGRIFDPFFTTKPAGKGTGLGLSVSRQLIRAAGGEVEVATERSTLGGARFIIRLPRAMDEEHQP